jgi:hypothetical protein
MTAEKRWKAPQLFDPGFRAHHEGAERHGGSARVSTRDRLLLPRVASEDV